MPDTAKPVRPTRTATIRVWLTPSDKHEWRDDPPSVTYTKTFKGRAVTAHARFLRAAQRQFIGWQCIQIG